MQVELLNKAGFLWQSEESAKWMVRYEQWKEYYWEHKTPHVDPSKNLPLSRWVTYQRRNCDKLSTMQVEQLNNFGFIWKSEDKAWMIRFEQWKEYSKEHKTPHVSRGKNLPLSSWVYYQRNNRDNLSANKVQLLDEAGFVWDILPRWAHSFERCIQNVNEHNTSIVDKCTK